MTKGPYVGRGILAIVAIVLLGVVLAETDVMPGSSDRASAEVRAGSLEVTAFLGRQEQRLVTGAFRGGQVAAFMGSVEVDLRDAVMAGEVAVVDLGVMMGRVELRIPEHWTVEPDLGAALTATEIDVFSTEADAGAPRLVLRGGVLLGRLTVRN